MRVTVAEPAKKPAIPTVLISAAPSKVKKGETSVLKWVASNATEVSIDHGIGAVKSSGSRQVRPTSSTTYTIVARGEGGTAKDSAQIAVIAEPPPKAVPDDVVVDSGLMWTRKDNGADIDWPSAKRYCEGLKFGGHSSWRLPTIDELERIYDKNNITGKWSYQNSEYDIHTIEGFRLTTPVIWSATKKGSARAWYFDFGVGFRRLGPLVYSGGYRALCVRRSGE